MMNLFTRSNNSHSQNQGNLAEFTLEEFFESYNPLPAYSVFLGLCEDGIPLILNLTDSMTGSLLIAGDDDYSNYMVSSSLLTAAYCFNSSHEVNIHLISQHLFNFSRLLKTPHLNLFLKPGQIETSIAFEELVNLGKQGRVGDPLIPYHLVAIEGLDSFIQISDFQIPKLLTWLIENGPEVGIFDIATIEASQITTKLFPMLNCFPSRILNEISDPSLARYISGVREPDLSNHTS